MVPYCFDFLFAPTTPGAAVKVLMSPMKLVLRLINRNSSRACGRGDTWWHSVNDVRCSYHMADWPGLWNDGSKFYQLFGLIIHTNDQLQNMALYNIWYKKDNPSDERSSRWLVKAKTANSTRRWTKPNVLETFFLKKSRVLCRTRERRCHRVDLKDVAIVKLRDSS